ncbi:MAG: hypothetical protein JKY34_09800 [Kordiimonadaceae bacterium]|nr:hypothetical protein [Kordiimonadaceae bacterium]
MKKTILLIALSVIAASLVSYGLAVVYMQNSDFNLSVHGHIAAGLAIFFTYALGAALMTLLFFSNKHGHDAEVHFIFSEKNTASPKDGDADGEEQKQ